MRVCLCSHRRQVKAVALHNLPPLPGQVEPTAPTGGGGRVRDDGEEGDANVRGGATATGSGTGDEVRRDVEYVQGRRCAQGEGELQGIQEEANLRSDSCAAHVRWYCAIA